MRNRGLESGIGIAAATLILLVIQDPLAFAQGHSWNFDDDALGRNAPGFTDATGQWRVAEDASAPSGSHVLAQESANAGSVFNVVFVDDTSFEDVDVSVRLRGVAGREDQGGGVVWRAQDVRNYYVARYNPLEDNFRVYSVKDGVRRMLRSVSVELDHDAWHTVRATMRGDHIECYLDGTRSMDTDDGTFSTGGMIGLWTKADAQTHFDDLAAHAARPIIDPSVVSLAIGVEAKEAEDGTVRAVWPRTDVLVTVDGMAFTPPAGLTTWAAFAADDGRSMVMGDVVVFQDEVSPAMDAAFAHRLEITALHNHFFFDEPKVYFMHIAGRGDTGRLAAGVKAVWDAVRAVRRASPVPASRFPGQIPSTGSIDADRIGTILGYSATTSAGVVKVSIGRTATMAGVTFGGSMGLRTWAAFSGSDALAAVDGDFAMTAAEVQPVLRTLRKAGIHIVALHNHMIGENPAYFFTHFWGTGPAADLARGIRAALDAQGSGT
jgi:hypothetical protein